MTPPLASLDLPPVRPVEIGRDFFEMEKAGPALQDLLAGCLAGIAVRKW